LEPDETWLGVEGGGLAFSSFHRYVRAGMYPENWAGGLDNELTINERE